MKIYEIRKQLAERNKILKKNYKDKMADFIEKDITRSLRKNFRHYPSEFILETLSKFGQAPNLVYDDNGNWAVSCDGMQPVVTGKEKLEGALTVFVEKKDWSRTVRGAIRKHLFSYK